MKFTFGRPVAAVAGTLAVAAVLAGCSGTSEDNSASSLAVSDDAVPAATFSQELHDALPAAIRDAGELKTAGIIFPPYANFLEDGKTVEGINVDMADAFGTVLGVDVTFDAVASTTDVYTGLASGRFDLGVNPYSDTPATQESYDFVDWLREYVSFAVQTGNPDNIDSLESTCGKNIATLQGGSAEKVLQETSATCESGGNEPVTISTFPDQSTAILSVQSGRTDAAFSSQVPLTYYVEKSDGGLELAGANQENGFSNLIIGTFVSKGNPLASVMLDVFRNLDESGTYEGLMKKYGLDQNIIDEFGMNLEGQTA